MTMLAQPVRMRSRHALQDTPAVVAAPAVAAAGALATAPAVAFIQLGRLGDIVNILPIMRQRHLAGERVYCYVHPGFAEIFEAVSYVTPLRWPGSDVDVKGAFDHASASPGFAQVLDTQVNGAFRPAPAAGTDRSRSYQFEPWARCGVAESFHDLPLVFDRRDRLAEAAAIKLLSGRSTPGRSTLGRKPLLAYALSGHSSPFAAAQNFAAWLKETFADQFELLDLCAIRLPKAHHLLGAIECAALTGGVLLAVDSLPLHLAHAFGTRTIALQTDADPTGDRENAPWYHSAPRRNWLASLRYAEALSDAGKRRIAGLLRGLAHRPLIPRPGAAAAVERIFHVVDWFDSTDHAERGRLLRARRTWQAIGYADPKWKLVVHRTERDARRSSRDLGDSRKLPFIKDLLDFAARDAGDQEIVIFTNADTCLCPEGAGAVRRKLEICDCCFSRRIDVDSSAVPLRVSDLVGRPHHVGADLFAMRAGWWREHAAEFPDLIYAAEGWDFCCRWLMLRYCPEAEITPPCIYHEFHLPFWAGKRVIHDNPAQKYCRRVAAAWAREYGLSAALYRDGTDFLFKPDWSWT